MLEKIKIKNEVSINKYWQKTWGKASSPSSQESTFQAQLHSPTRNPADHQIQFSVERPAAPVAFLQWYCCAGPPGNEYVKICSATFQHLNAASWLHSPHGLCCSELPSPNHWQRLWIFVRWPWCVWIEGRHRFYITHLFLGSILLLPFFGWWHCYWSSHIIV